MRFKSQTATEYLIIAAVVIIIALVVVLSLGGIPGIGGNAKVQANAAALRTGVIGIVDIAATAGSTTVYVKNNAAKTITLTSLLVGNISCNDPMPVIMSIGVEKLIDCPALPGLSLTGAPTGEFSIAINYTDPKTSATYSYAPSQKATVTLSTSTGCFMAGESWVDTGNSISGNYVKSSDDGTTLLAMYNMGNCGTVSISLNSATTWSDSGLANDCYYSAAISGDGSILAVARDSGPVYISNDSGSSWTTHGAFTAWGALSMSDDGTKIVRGTDDGTVYTSTDTGATWTNRGQFGSMWTAIASSADGSKQAGIQYNGDIYISSDSGATWTDTGQYAYQWIDIASSSDGSTLVAVSVIEASDGYGLGYIYTSHDSGATWTNTTQYNDWWAVAMSDDGMKIAVTDNYGYVSTSGDSGVTWIDQGQVGSNGDPGIAMSSDGKKIVKVENGGNVWVSTCP